MTIIGYHASHEQIAPADLLASVRHAEQAGFGAAMCSDHFAPWSERQGESGFAWAWLGAALEATSLRFGVVTAPGQRYHPAVIAQAMTTLESMYPGRFWAALGSGEAVNEHITGDRWLPKEQRVERLGESARVIRSLLAGHEVSTSGHITVDRARVWSRPDAPPPVHAAAVSAETARWAASWADGLITVGQPMAALRGVVDAYRDGGGRGPLMLQLHLSYADSDDEALHIAWEQWRTNVFGEPLSWDIETPAGFEEAARHVRPPDLHDTVLVSSSTQQHADWIAERRALGFDEIYLHHVGKPQRHFIDAFGERVLQQFREAPVEQVRNV
ncbi:TIGR03885 family FMN-dependent LLM class oxidoreductase [Okibacterium endophyticum]